MNNSQQKGFTLIELMIMIAVIGVLAAIALPSYKRNVIATKRTDMMTELQNMASRLESQKMAMGKYQNVADMTYPQGSTPLYNVTTTLDSNRDGTNGDWIITANPIASGQMKDDGKLTLDSTGKRCRDKNNDGTFQTTECGFSNEWKD